MQKTTVSILGSGWLGLPLTIHLKSKGYVIKGSTTRASRLKDLSFHNIESYVVNIDNLDDRGSPFWQSDVLICNIPSKNIDGFRNLVSHIERSQITKVLFVSSTSVYVSANKTIAESDGQELSSSPLVAIEKLFANSKRFVTTIVRFGGLVGYSRNPANFFRPGRPIRDPDSYVNLIHRDDCINIIERIVEKDFWGEVFNACADTHPSKRDFYTQVARQSGLPAPVFSDEADKSFKIISNQKVKQLLEYEFIHSDLMKINFQQPVRSANSNE